MTTAATSLLGLALPVTGELAGTWGDTVNNSITSLLDTAVAGTTTLSTDADVTLTTTELSSNQARQAILLWTAGGTATRTITAPAKSKIYTVINASSSTQSIKLVGVGPTTGVTIVKGEAAICAWNGTDFIKVSNTSGSGTFTDLTVTGNTVLGDADTDTLTFNASFVTGTTLKTAKVATNTLALAAYDVDGTAYTNLITLTASNTPTLALTSTAVGTINNMSIGATTASTGAFTTLSASSDVTLSGGTANGVLYLNGSKVATSGSALTFDGNILTNSTGAIRASGATVPSSGAGLELLYGASGTGISTLLSYDRATSAYKPLWIDGSYQAYFISGSEGMRLTSTGLGIGTSSLDSAFRFGVYGTNSSAVFQNSATGVTSSDGFAVGNFGTTTAYVYNYEATPLVFGTSGAEKMRLDSSGNLGLGVTPSAWGSPFKALQISYAGARGSTATLGLSHNAYYDGTSFKYIANGYATDYYQNAGAHVWQTTASGTAGNAITFTQAMTLDASGNLGIGTTSPGVKLDVVTSTAGPHSMRVYNSASATNSYAQVQIQADTSNFYLFKQSTASTGIGGAGSANLYNEGAYPMVFYTNATERARIDSSGNFFVGTTSQIASARSVITGASGNAQVIYFNNTRNNGTGDATAISLLGSSDNNTSNYHYIGTTGGTDRVLIYGNGNIVNTNNSYGALSDVKLKENIVDATPKLEKLQQVRVVNYNLIGETQKQIGVVAQELEEIFPSMIDETPDRDTEGNDLGTTTKSVKYSVFVPMLIKAIQELKAEFDAYKASHP